MTIQAKLEPDLKMQLIAAAKSAAQQAYAPYSHYRVGAAVLTVEGCIFQGCNVENASYGLTICAERVAIFAARCGGSSAFQAVAVYAPQLPPPMPCGACRQVMAEGGNHPLVIIVSADGTIQEFQLGDLLPYSFSLTGDAPHPQT